VVPVAADSVTVAGVTVATPVVAAVVAAGVAALVSLLTVYVTGRRAATDRQRALFADAYGTCAKYREYVFRARRRAPGIEAQHAFTELLSDVQQEMTRHQALLMVEAPAVGRRFDVFVQQLRKVAGGEIRRALDRPPLAEGEPLHIHDVDLSALEAPERAFLETAADHLSLGPLWWNRLRRWPARKWHRRGGRRAAGAPAALDVVPVPPAPGEPMEPSEAVES
jgi:hypothetical protein